MARCLLYPKAMPPIHFATIRRPLVLVVDEDYGPREALRMVFSHDYDVLLASTPDEARTLLSRHDVDLLTLELPRTRAAGLDLLSDVRGRFPDTGVLLVTSRADMDDVIRAMRLGIADVLRKPFDVAELRESARRAVARGAARRTSKLAGSFTILSRLVEDVERRTDTAVGHAQRVAFHADLLAEHLGISKAEREPVRQAGMLHDIGKIGLPEELLLYPAALDAREKITIEQHTSIGARLLAPFALDELVACGVRHHHERWDGGGYPDRLRGDEIPLAARIVQLADAWDAMTSVRTYRQPLSTAAAMHELVRGAGSQFDPTLTKEFVKLIELHRADSGDDPSLVADRVADAIAAAWGCESRSAASVPAALTWGGSL